MKLWTRIVVGLIAMSAGLCAVPLRAQEDNPEKPQPAARVLLPLPDLSGDQQDSDQSSQSMLPDHGPVTGVQNATLGTSQLRHSYWVPGLQYGNTAQTNSVSSGWTTTNYVTGNISLLEAWGHSSISANYSGGESFSSASSQGSLPFHQLSSAFEVDHQRWQALVIEQFSYLPESSFGFGGSTGLSVPGITGGLSVAVPGLQQMYLPGQSILSTTGPRYSSTSSVQLAYAVSRRGSFSVAAVYGFLRFVNSGNVNNDSEILNVGYSYTLTRKDYVGFNYRFSAFHFPGVSQAVGDQAFQLMYARRITGRLALNIGGGPDVTQFRSPISGDKQTMAGSAAGSLTYAFGPGTLKTSYTHGISSGSGVFSGSKSDQLDASLARTLGRLWNAGFNLGFARNTTIVTVKGLPSPSYNSWVTGAGLNRPLTRSTRFAVGYQAQIQASSGVACGTSVCQTTGVTHQVQMSFQWNAPPQVLR